MSDGTTTPDRCPTCFICCESEAERPEDALLATGCACSRAGASGGRAHLQCIVAAAKHDEAHWTQCSICKQQWSGPLEVGLSRARYESLSQSLPDDDIRRVIAKLNLASCQRKNGAPGALADATQLYEEVLETWRRTLGVRNQRTLTVMLNLSMAYEDAGRVEPGLALAQEALGVLQICLAQGRRLRMGVGGSSDEEHTPEAHDTELKTRTGLLGKMLATTSRLYANTGRHAAARPLMEACVEVSKGTGDVVSQAHNMCNLGVRLAISKKQTKPSLFRSARVSLYLRCMRCCGFGCLRHRRHHRHHQVCLSNIGDIQAGRQVKTDAVQLSQRVLGPTHPHTRAIADTAEQGRRDESESDERKARAIGRLVGLSKTELNGALVFVLDYVAAKGRYKVSTHGSETVYARQARASGAKPLGIKPENVVLKSGTAVVIGKAGPVPAALAECEGVRCILQVRWQKWLLHLFLHLNLANR
jgi:hypothetical protein